MLCMGCMVEIPDNKSCPHCGYTPNSDYDSNYLKPETVLSSRYIIGRLLRKNGESGLYLAFDYDLNKKVWIREYFPHTLAERKGSAVFPLDGYGAQYKTLMSDFAEVCNTLDNLRSEPVVAVESVFYDNHTIYAVHRYTELITLESYLAQNGNKMSASSALDLLMPLFGTVQAIHNLGEIHRGISPYTIFVTSSGKALLGDFAMSAARTGGSELEAELYNGFTPPEQYAINGWQGEWSDVYAMAAVLYRVISGTVPPKSTLLGQKRALPALSELAPKTPLQMADAIAAAMQTNYEKRTQTIAGLASDLIKPPDIGKTAVFDAASAVSGSADDYDYDDDDRRAKSGTFKFLALAMLLTVAVLIGFMYFIATTIGIIPAGPAVPESSSGSSSSAPVSQSSLSSSAPPPSSSSSEAHDPAVPRFVGQEFAAIEATESYKERFIFDMREQFNNTYKAGVVYDQAPVEGTLMPNRGTVVIYVSKGPAMIETPSLIGMTLEEAMTLLYELEQELDFALPIEIIEVYSPDGKPGQIVRTYPVAGDDLFPERQDIEVYVVREPEVIESIDVSQVNNDSPEPDDPPSQDDISIRFPTD